METKLMTGTKMLVALAVMGVASACFEATDTSTPVNGNASALAGTAMSGTCGQMGNEVLVLVDTSLRMSLPSGFSQGAKDISRSDVITDSLKQTLPHLKKKVDFGLVTFPFDGGQDSKGEPIVAPDSCDASDVTVKPGQPYGWLVSSLEHIAVGGNANVAAALIAAQNYYASSTANTSKSVVLFTAGMDECGGDAIAAAKALADAGIPTYVFSFPNAVTPDMAALATAGGRPSSEPSGVYFVVPGRMDTVLVDSGTLTTIPEICDGVDNDCDGVVDEGFDMDGDGWAGCMGDCDDDDPAVYPGAADDVRYAPYAATRVPAWSQGLASDMTPVAEDRSSAVRGLEYDGGAPFTLGIGGVYDVEFDCPVANGSGKDLRVVQVLVAGATAKETGAVYAWDMAGKAWVLLGTVGGTSGDTYEAELDLGSLSMTNRIRIVDTTNVNGNKVADGFDVKGVYSLQDCGLCDGKDNDCSGDQDESFGVGGACVATADACGSNGHVVCSADGMAGVCKAESAGSSVEICDGIDNDCDGMTDEGLAKACDEGCGAGMMYCLTASDLPAGIAPSLTAGFGSCTVTKPNAELCDGIDNDCDGQIDEGFDVGAACTAGMNACAKPGVKVCSADGLEAVCAVDGDTNAMAEICDGIDNDCDGQIDNGKLCPKGEVCYMGACVLD